MAMNERVDDNDETETELKQLKGLKINEISGVDKGANLLTGWAVLKSKGPDVIRQHEALKRAVEVVAPSLKDAPAKVQEALSTVIDWLEGLDVAKAVVERLQKDAAPRSRKEIWKDIEQLGRAQVRKTKDTRPIESVIGDLLRTDPLARELYREHEQSRTP